jgi:hypothetical protein
MRWTLDDFDRVRHLTESGLSDYAVAAHTGVPRATVARWRRRHEPPRHLSDEWRATGWSIKDAPAFAYLLGCYLGDGHVTHRPPRSWVLRVACDRRYDGIIEEVKTAMVKTFPGGRPTQIHASQGASEVISICHPAVQFAFPQHGPGRKHARPIVLADWQRACTREHPGALLRGLIHSDGCRVTNRVLTVLPSGRFAVYSYARYFFSNLSADIRSIFVEHCALLGVRVTQSNHRNLSVSHRDSVALLDRIVGPKQ